MGKVSKGVGCSVTGCSAPATRSISRNQLGDVKLSVAGEGRRVYLCQPHYKEWKKATKRSREIDRLRW